MQNLPPLACRPIAFGISLIAADTGRGGWPLDVPCIRASPQGMRLQPQRASGDGWINAGILPPGGFIAKAMGLAMMPPAQRHGELVTCLAAQRAVLREAQMVGIWRPAPTNQARLFGHELDVLLVTKAARLRMGELALVNAIGGGCPGGPYRLPRER